MKKGVLIAGVALAAVSAAVVSVVSIPARATMDYECWTYIGSKPDKMFHVSADNKDQAVQMAMTKARQLNFRYDYIKCK